MKTIEEYYRTIYNRDNFIQEVAIPVIQNQDLEELPDITGEEIQLTLEGMKNNKTHEENDIA